MTRSLLGTNKIAQLVFDEANNSISASLVGVTTEIELSAADGDSAISVNQTISTKASVATGISTGAVVLAIFDSTLIKSVQPIVNITSAVTATTLAIVIDGSPSDVDDVWFPILSTSISTLTLGAVTAGTLTNCIAKRIRVRCTFVAFGVGGFDLYLVRQ
jgi:hypothetical protein